MKTHGLGKRLLLGAAVVALVTAGCAASATTAPVGAFKLHLQLTPAHPSVAIAADRGFFNGIDLAYEMVDFGASSQLFHAGTDPIGNESPWEASAYQSQGKDIRYFSPLEASNLIAPVFIRTADKDRYKTMADLKGKKVGIPGFGTGTFAAFETVMKGLEGIDVKKDFQLVEGNPGDLEGLLQTKAIDAAITFTGPSAHAIANPAYTVIFDMNETWKKAQGVYLPVAGWIADAQWLDDHLQIAKNFLAGVQKGLDTLKSDPTVLDEGKPYEKWGKAGGFLLSQEVKDQSYKWIKDSYYYIDGSVYTQSWADTVYKFIQMGEGVLVDKVPAEDKVFYYKTFVQ
jgi:ABC-type nitrate/sulfonate/bicarbonate transport system substrate-binding protein